MPYWQPSLPPSNLLLLCCSAVRLFDASFFELSFAFLSRFRSAETVQMMPFFALLPVGYRSCTPLESFPPRFEGQVPIGSYSLSPFAKVLFPRLRSAWILMVSNPCFSRRFSIPIFPRFQSECSTTVWLAFYLPRFRLFLHTQHPLYMYHMQLCLSGTCPPWLSSPLTLIHSSCRGGSRFGLLCPMCIPYSPMPPQLGSD